MIGPLRGGRTRAATGVPGQPTVFNVLFLTTDGGESWKTISPDLSRPRPGVPPSVGEMAAKDPNGLEQRGAIYSLAPSSRKVGTLWAGTDDGFVWITRDEGGSWTNVTPPGLAPWSKVTQISASPIDDGAVPGREKVGTGSSIPGYGEAVGERPGEDRPVVVVVRLEALAEPGEAMPRRDGEERLS